MFFSNCIRNTGIAAMFVVITMVSQGFSAGSACCITPLKDSVVGALSGTPGVGQVTVQPGASCDSFKITWASYDPGMGHYMTCCVVNYKIVENNVEWSQSSDGIETSGILSGWCPVSIEKNALVPTGSTVLSVFPNPFRSQIRMSFKNPHGHAVFQVFDTKGTKLHEETVEGSSGMVWQTAGLRQGIYFARIKTSDRVYGGTIICIK